jgi:S1-C subfamily serine protease
MPRSWLAAIAIVVLLVTPAMAQSDTPTDAPTDQTPGTSTIGLSEADIAALVAPSVVQVLAGNKTGSGVAIGRGFITDQHVIDGADQIRIVTADGQLFDAFVARSDPGSDLALLLSEAPVSPLSLEPSSQQRQGDSVLAFGYPLGISGQPTLTRGVISAFRREPSGVQLLQTDAALNPGNSGGPIVNMRGNVIAVDEFSLKNAEGLNFGIASETVQAFLDGVTFAVPATPTSVTVATPTPFAVATTGPATAPPKPGLDYSVDGAPQHLDQGTFVKLDDSASIFVVSDQQFHRFPNWESFLRHGGRPDLSNVVILKHELTDRGNLGVIPTTIVTD